IVVLPEPLGPSRPTTRPGAISKLTSSTARTAPKSLVSAPTAIDGTGKREFAGTSAGASSSRWEAACSATETVIGGAPVGRPLLARSVGLDRRSGQPVASSERRASATSRPAQGGSRGGGAYGLGGGRVAAHKYR